MANRFASSISEVKNTKLLGIASTSFFRLKRFGDKYNMPLSLVFIPLILVYFTGPLGLVLYWIIRVFYAKRISFHD